MRREIEGPEDDTLLRSYLLGELRDEEADRVERRLLAEDGLFEHAEALEADLLAAADRGELAPEERARVLRRLASSPQGRERLALARTLNREAASRKETAPVLPFRPHEERAFRPRPAHWAALAASLTLLTVLSWTAWEHRGQAPNMEARVAGPTPPVARVEPRPTPPAAAPPAAVLALGLATTRDAGRSEAIETVELSPETPAVELQIDAGSLDAAKAYVLTVRQDGKEILQVSGLRPVRVSWGDALVATLPARRLPPGRYEVAVTPAGAGAAEEMTQLFEVARKGT